MVSSHSHVRAALEAALPQLRAALAEAVANTGQSNINSDAFAQGQSYQGQQEGRRDSTAALPSQDSDNEIAYCRPGSPPRARPATALSISLPDSD